MGAAHNHVDHRHSDPSHTAGWVLALGTALNLGLVIVQVVYGLASHSMALLADAGHNFGDVLSLLFAWGGLALSRALPTQHYTYGFRSASILAALLNAIILLVATGAIAWEAIRRLLFEPPAVVGLTVMVVAGVGIVVNGITAFLLMGGRRSDLNIRAAFVHMVADAGISAGVAIAGAIILWTAWRWIDPVTSLVISGVIVWGTWGLLAQSIRLTLDAVPPGIDPAAVRTHLETLPGVASTHDLHIWAMSTTETALTCHLVMPAGHPGDDFVASLADGLKHRFGIGHVTIQIELGDAGPCALQPEHVV